MACDVPVFVICRDRVSSLRALVGWLELVGQQRIYLVDNDSSYPPLLEYYANTPHHVVRLGENLGHLAPWTAGIIDQFSPGESYIVTDPDILPTDECPHDAVETLSEALERHPEYAKAGLGLKIDDIPDHYALKQYVQAWEEQYWLREVEPGLFSASVDTTFAVYRQSQAFAKRPALRTGPPYVARHLPWYVDGSRLTDEERYYRAHALASVNTWNRERLPSKLDGHFHRSPWARLRRLVQSFVESARNH